jgi:hypothetical protein
LLSKTITVCSRWKFISRLTELRGVVLLMCEV